MIDQANAHKGRFEDDESNSKSAILTAEKTALPISNTFEESKLVSASKGDTEPIGEDVAPDMKSNSVVEEEQLHTPSPLFEAEEEAESALSSQCDKFFVESGGEASSTLLDFLRVICLCHDVTRVTDRSGKTFLTGPSQDELCLMEMAAKTGMCEFIDRNSSVFTIKVQG